MAVVRLTPRRNFIERSAWGGMLLKIKAGSSFVTSGCAVCVLKPV